MNARSEVKLKVLTGGRRRVEELHDRVINLLDTNEKKGIRRLLKKNNESCQKLIYPYVKSNENHAEVMIALSGILEAHSRECYAIGYLDSLINRGLDSTGEITAEP